MHSSDSPTKLDANEAKCEPDPMTEAARKLLDEFDALPDRDRSELFAELVRRVALAPHDLPQDDDLVAAVRRPGGRNMCRTQKDYLAE